jgi:hypothetical protein
LLALGSGKSCSVIIHRARSRTTVGFCSSPTFALRNQRRVPCLRVAVERVAW